jgi:hypothetical protein
MRTPPCRGELSTKFQTVVDPAIIASETRSCESTTQAGPQRHVALPDADFYNCKPTNEICIEALLGDITSPNRSFEV